MLAGCAATVLPNSDETAEEARAIQQLRKEGADLSKPLSTRYYLYFPDERRARAAEAEVATTAYLVERVTRAARRPQWLLLVSKPTLMSVSELTAVSRELTVLARKHGGAYDGWDTEFRK